MLVHVDRPGPTLPRIQLMPMGTLSVASHLAKAGVPVCIWHRGIEERLTPGFSVVEELRATRPRLLGLTMSWHQQASEVLALTAKIHQALPELGPEVSHLEKISCRIASVQLELNLRFRCSSRTDTRS